MQAFDSVRFPRSLRSSNLGRKAAVLTILVMSAILAGAVTTSWMTVAVAPVFAACASVNQSCAYNDFTKTAVADAAYFIPGGGSVTPVEPTSATTWSMTAYWAEAPSGDCTDYTETAYVDVSWNGSAWSTSNFSSSANIGAAAVCALSSCGSHSSSYRLYVDVNDPVLVGTSRKNLRQVVFTATTVPNGNDFNSGTCALGSGRTPTAASFSGTDTGAFECAYNCTATGTTVSLTYN